MRSDAIQRQGYYSVFSLSIFIAVANMHTTVHHIAHYTIAS